MRRLRKEHTVCGQIFWEMKLWVSSFPGFKLSFVRRTANKVTHACARVALFLNSSFIFYTDIPGFLIATVELDLFSSME